MTQSNTSRNFPGPCPLNSTHLLALTLPPTHTHLWFSLICSAQQTNKQTINNWVSSQFHWFCSQLCLEIHPGSAGDYLSSNAANCLPFPNNEKSDHSLRRHITCHHCLPLLPLLLRHSLVLSFSLWYRVQRVHYTQCFFLVPKSHYANEIKKIHHLLLPFQMCFPETVTCQETPMHYVSMICIN